MPKCIILEKVRDGDTLHVYKPKKDKNGNDVEQEVPQAFYDRAIGTQFIKAVDSINESEIDSIELTDEVPEGEELKEGLTVIPDLEEKTVDELKAIAEERGIELKSSMKKGEIIEAIRKELYKYE